MRLPGSFLLFPIIFDTVLVAADDACILDRDVEACSQGDEDRERLCLREQNPLRRVMDCVSVDEDYDEHLVCRKEDNGREDSEENYIGEDGWVHEHLPSMCLHPKNVLIDGTNDIDCSGSGLLGVFEGCPFNDEFFSCVCHHCNAQRGINILSKCFKLPTTNFELTCFEQPSYCLEQYGKRKESFNLEPPLDKLENIKRALFAREGLDFQVDEYGQLLNADGYSEFPLLYYTRTILNNTALRRCYISPTSTERWCVSWLAEGEVTADDYPGAWPGASYGHAHDEYGDYDPHQEDEDDDFHTPTRTQAPSTPHFSSVAVAIETSRDAETPASPEDSTGHSIRMPSLHVVAFLAVFCIVPLL